MTDRRKNNGGARPGAGRPRQQTPAESHIIVLIELSEERLRNHLLTADAYQEGPVYESERRLADIERAYSDGLQHALKAIRQ